MNNFKTYHLFSIPLSEFYYGEISDDEISTCNHYLKNLSRNTNNSMSFEGYILDKDLPKIREFIEKSIVAYVEKNVIGGEYDQEQLKFQITQSWLNLTKPGESHHQHSHSNSFISGVFYFKANSKVDNITFYNNLLNNTTFLEFNTKKHNEFNSKYWTFPVETGQLILFPSSLEHFVGRVVGDEDRISLSFNVFPFGILGKDEDSTGLRILQDK